MNPPEGAGDVPPAGPAHERLDDLTESVDEAIARLGKLSPAEYEQVRVGEAKRLNMRVSRLDRLVADERPARRPGTGQGQKIEMKRPAPWCDPVDGAALLGELSAFIARHVFVPAGAADAIAAWVLHTYSFDLFRHTPRLAILSSEPRCGKATLLDALGLLACNPLPTAHTTAAALFRVIELSRPTMLIDEADTFLKDSEEVRGILNAGAKVGGQVVRCVGDDFDVRAFAVFSPVAIAAIRSIRATIADRSIIINLVRATRSERPGPLDEATEKRAGELAAQCERWTIDHRDALAALKPALPAHLFNRAADVWRAPCALAQTAGGDWPARLARACQLLSPREDEDAQSRGTRLLSACRAAFVERDASGESGREHERISSADLLEKLLADPLAGWGEANRGRPVTQNLIARWLRPYRISPAPHRIGGTVAKGYQRIDFEDAWRRYLADDTSREPEAASQPLHRYNPQNSAENAAFTTVTGFPGVTVAKSAKAMDSVACNGVTVANPKSGDESPSAPGDCIL